MRPSEGFTDRMQPWGFSPGNHGCSLTLSQAGGRKGLTEEEYQVLNLPHGEKQGKGSGRSSLTDSSCRESRAGAPPPHRGFSSVRVCSWPAACIPVAEPPRKASCPVGCGIFQDHRSNPCPPTILADGLLIAGHQTCPNFKA